MKIRFTFNCKLDSLEKTEPRANNLQEHIH